MPAEDNVPRLKDVDPPFDLGPERVSVRQAVPRMLKYMRYSERHGKFVVPRSLDIWRYRQMLAGLDRICTRALGKAGAMAAPELAEWINREKAIKTEPEKTGINSITKETIEDWLELARRRELVTECQDEGHGIEARWMLTERGHTTLRSPFVAFLFRTMNLIPILISGIAIAVVWVRGNDTALAIAIVALSLGLYFVGALAFGKLWQRQTEPAEAVVTIETYRSAGKPLPSLRMVLPPAVGIAD